MSTECNNFFVNTPITQGFYNTGFVQPYATCTTYTGYYARYLLLKVMSVFKPSFPEEWDFGLDDYFMYNLFISGNIPVFYSRKYGFICQWGAYSGVNIALRPEYVTFQNQFMTREIRKINTDCVIFSLTRDYCGIWDKVVAYAELLAEMHVAIKVNIINSKNPVVFAVPDKKIAQDMAKLFDTVQSGQAAAFYKQTGDSKSWEMFNPQAKTNYITPDMLIDMRKIVNMFCTDFGIPNANTEKKERLITDEVNANNGETDCWIESVMERLLKCCDKVEKIFGKRYIDFEWSDALKGVKEYAASNVHAMGAVPDVSGNSR